MISNSVTLSKIYIFSAPGIEPCSIIYSYNRTLFCYLFNKYSLMELVNACFQKHLPDSIELYVVRIGSNI